MSGARADLSRVEVDAFAQRTQPVLAVVEGTRQRPSSASADHFVVADLEAVLVVLPRAMVGPADVAELDLEMTSLVWKPPPGS